MNIEFNVYKAVEVDEGYDIQGEDNLTGKTAIIDVDTLIIAAALSAQESYVLINKKGSSKKLEYKNITEFWGSYPKRQGGKLADINKSRAKKGLPLYSYSDFEVEECARLVSQGKDISPEVIAKGRFKRSIQYIQDQPWCGDFIICYGEGENFRYNEAQTQPYKSTRMNKPILYPEVRDYMLKRYSDKVIRKSGVETDDIISELLYKAYIKADKDLDKVDVVGCFIDKDILQVPCLHYNFNKPEEGVSKVEQIDSDRSLASQMLMGDKIDTIPALPALDNFLHEKYDVRKSKSLGATTASNYLKTL